MRKKTGLIIALAFIIIAACLFFVFTRQHRQSQNAKRQDEKAGLTIRKVSNGNEQGNAHNYNNDEWMLMGYMAYARDNYKESRHIQNTADLVNDVQQDLADESLKAEKTGTNTYSLNNKFGGVDLKVEEAAVKVTGDGTIIIAKTELKKTFGSYAAQVKKMTQDINSNGSSEASSSKSNKQNVNFNNDELAVAAYIDGAEGSTVQDKINLIKNTLHKDQNSSIKNFPSDDYLSGIYHNKGVLSIAYNLGTTAYTSFYISDNSDRIKIKNRQSDSMPAKSKRDLIQKYDPYKADVDQILQGIEYNRRQMPRISKLYNREANRNNN